MQAVQLAPTGMIVVKSVTVQMVELVQWMGHAYAPQELLDTTAQSKVLRITSNAHFAIVNLYIYGTLLTINQLC